MDPAVFDHEGPWTEDVFLDLPHDGHVEVVDGTLFIGPTATEQRADVVGRVREAVESALPDGLRVREAVPLRLGPDCVLVPDLVVTTAATESKGKGDDEVLEAAAALMVIEVVGRDHGIADRSFKPQLYARSRIPYSLLIDHDGPTAVADMIIGGRYHEYARAGAGEQLRIEEPFVLELDLVAVAGPDEEPEARAGA
ncbi:Uma2 family endonuclease [Pseudonocardia alaniniphila]|uniref:Uma2 family endonuclease n=1 Tax=Pseudonocardia alaniniphila TaxID=75291 RepID=A0ABS9TJ63_9PSEU|nr:Uma2 family endonuclease [Pseudonocardia alaniniphila]MCH6168579.1 Uma2 family endonuclease [Pseudonocardia alaniniphila]